MLELLWSRTWPPPAVDPYFGLPLWLQTKVGREVLWAYDHEHLRFIKRFVEASLRERVPNVNTSLASRLPRWIQRSRNREPVLRAIGRLERR